MSNFACSLHLTVALMNELLREEHACIGTPFRENADALRRAYAEAVATCYLLPATCYPLFATYFSGHTTRHKLQIAVLRICEVEGGVG